MKALLLIVCLYAGAGCAPPCAARGEPTITHCAHACNITPQRSYLLIDKKCFLRCVEEALPVCDKAGNYPSEGADAPQ